MLVNILSFDLFKEVIELEAKPQKKERETVRSIFKDEVPELWTKHPELESTPKLYFSIKDTENDCEGNSYSVPISLFKSRRLTKHILNKYLYNFFKQKAYVGFDFLNNIEVWVNNQYKQGDKSTVFRRYSVVPKYATITDKWELLISYNGTSTVYNTAISKLDLSTSSYRVITDREIVKYKDLTPEQKQNISKTYPVINKSLAKELQISEVHRRVDNKYLPTIGNVRDFIDKFFQDEVIADIIKLDSKELITIPDDRIDHVHKDSNKLLFANGNTGIDPYSGVFGTFNRPGYGPFRPSSLNDVKFFFISRNEDIEICRHLYSIFSNGTLNKSDQPICKTLSETIKQPFSTDRGGSIYFDLDPFDKTNLKANTEQAFQKIQEGINKKQFNPNTRYVAIYISPIDRDDVNSDAYPLYFKIKELLLNKGITSQAIYKENPTKANFRFHIPNIASAILAKIDGQPWILPNTRKRGDVIIGVGAFKHKDIGKRYIGSAFCFSEEGIFKNCDCYRDDDLDKIIRDIRKAVKSYIKNQEEVNRVIIHYYKTMKDEDCSKILRMLSNLNLDVPVYIVTINKTETHDYVAFDTDSTGLMPISGTYIKVGYNEFLLYNNSRYNDAGGNYDYLFPIKVKLSKHLLNGTKDDEILRMEEVRELLNQVYKLSRMNWKSVKQQNLPITILYPEMVAKMIPYFQDDYLPPFGKNSMWFL